MGSLERLLEALDSVRRSGQGWSARCPAHEDQEPSLSIHRGRDGRVLVHCHAGCTLEQVVKAAGLELRDLFPDASGGGSRAWPTGLETGLEDVIQRCLYGVQQSRGPACELVGRYEYGTVVEGRLMVLRFEGGSGRKTFRQIHQAPGGGWVIGRPDGRLLPYRIERCEGASTVWVVEGETCVGTLEELGLVATTSAGGARAARRTDWTRLSGKRILVVPDSDPAGESYAEDVVACIGAASCQVVRIPGLEPGEDVRDWVGRLRSEGLDSDRIRERLEQLAQENRVAPGRVRQEFPIELLPYPVQAFAKAVAHSRCVDVQAPAALTLAAMSSAIGLSRVMQDEYADWKEYPILWLALVAPSGTRKSVLLDDMFGPLHARQVELTRRYEAERSVYERAQRKAKASRGRGSSPPEDSPDPPVPGHIYTTDSTPEALVDILRDSPHGVLIAPDELTTFLGAIGKYSGRQDADRAFYLSLFSGAAVKRDRRSTGPVLVPRAAASVVGGIQPRILVRCFDPDAFGSGLVARFLLVRYEPRVKHYGKGPDPGLRRSYWRLLEDLLALREGVGSEPVSIPLSEEAQGRMETFVPEHSAEGLAMGEELHAAMSKLEAYALRFALVLRVAREVTGEAAPDDPISLQDLEAGITLVRWFRDEAQDLYSELRGEAHASADPLARRVELIRERFDGAVTRREWSKLNTRKPRKESDQELEQLVAAGLAEWRTRKSPKGGRQTEECALLPGPDGGEPAPEGTEVSGCGLRVQEADDPDVPEDRPSGPQEEDFGPQSSVEPAPACTPQPETQNPPQPTSSGLPPILDQALQHFDGEEVSAEPIAVPWSGPTCRHCRGDRRWRLVLGGPWRCANCMPPDAAGAPIQFEESQGHGHGLQA